MTQKVDLPGPKEFHHDTVNYLAQQRVKPKQALDTVSDLPISVRSRVTKRRTDSPKNAMAYLKQMKSKAIDYSNLDEIDDAGSRKRSSSSTRKNNGSSMKKHPALMGKSAQSVE